MIPGAYCDRCMQVQPMIADQCEVCGLDRVHPVVDISQTGLVSPARRYPAERVTRTEWTVDGIVIVRERGDGKYDVADWHAITTQDLERLHAVIGQLLTDLAARTITH